MAKLENILKKALITEKTSTAGDKFNRYGFVVELRANKNQIKEAVESFYNVKVLNVKTSILPGKVKRRGTKTTKTSKTKKAFVQLKDGQKIEFFKGV